MINLNESLPFHAGAQNKKRFPADILVFQMMGRWRCDAVCVRAVVLCVQPTLSQVLSNRGCAEDGALQPLDEEGGERKEEVWFYGKEKRSPLKKRQHA